MSKQNFEIVVMNTFDNMGKAKLLILTLVLTFRKNIKDIAMIDGDAYHLAWRLKKAQVFAISMRDLEFQAEKKG